MNTDATTTCLIRPIPDMCRGARGSAALSGGVIYDEAAVWGLGKLRTQVSGYNPAYVTLTPYNFTNATVTDAVTWKPSVYTGVSGAIYTDVTSSGGACASDSYNVAASAYTLISWEQRYRGLAVRGFLFLWRGVLCERFLGVCVS